MIWDQVHLEVQGRRRRNLSVPTFGDLVRNVVSVRTETEMLGAYADGVVAQMHNDLPSGDVAATVETPGHTVGEARRLAEHAVSDTTSASDPWPAAMLSRSVDVAPEPCLVPDMLRRRIAGTGAPSRMGDGCRPSKGLTAQLARQGNAVSCRQTEAASGAVLTILRSPITEDGAALSTGHINLGIRAGRDLAPPPSRHVALHRAVLLDAPEAAERYTASGARDRNNLRHGLILRGVTPPATTNRAGASSCLYFTTPLEGRP